MSNYFNEAGEPLMDGAAMRYEMYLDSMDDAGDASARFYDNEPDEDCDECPECGGYLPEGGHCWECGFSYADDDYEGGE